MGFLDFLGPFKILIYILLSVLIAWLIMITILVPFSFFLTVPGFLIIGIVWSVAAIMPKQKCVMIDGKMDCGSK